MVTIKKTEMRGRGRHPKITEKVKDDVITMYQRNFPVQMIVDKHGISKASVYRIINERTVDE